ncbi:glutamate/aspartate periplasmic-binding protein [Burkholderia oklahomensis]|uniref:Glutamate/aspartate periplasmic-binding protein n=1 Tax=Burkholderia oklahomensis TaxID=342113 RepID=A0AAI8BBZ8_9BURK|nr:glutamate/aspartate periplasmic-binding protein [Burkholderia oklahomensis]AOI39420.1 hypothetical protein WG70_07150 [Burkholderia oklahomensis EO147]KUY53672.1 hypothetical protein WG70_13400 [Burkholderia oklahomensis EO147]
MRADDEHARTAAAGGVLERHLPKRHPRFGARKGSGIKDFGDFAGTPVVHGNYACMLRRDDPELKKLVDSTIAQMRTSGEAEKLDEK